MGKIIQNLEICKTMKSNRKKKKQIIKMKISLKMEKKE